jgi:hypothetical protein
LRDLLVLVSALGGFALMLFISRRFLSTSSNRSKLTPVVLRKNIA